MLALRLREEPVRASADQCSLATAEAFARRPTPLHTIASGVAEPGTGEIAGPADFMELLALGDVHSFDPAAAWRPRPACDRLRVPIGLGEAGRSCTWTSRESAQQGMGPHGLVIGATGPASRSSCARSCSASRSPTPEQLNMVLVDFKGGATFAGMTDLPHVSAVITNLAQELTLVDRMQDALSGRWCVGRSCCARPATSRPCATTRRPAPAVRTWRRCRRCSSSSTSSPRCSRPPEFIDLFVAIGRLGRSLGLHLLLASQRLEEGRLRGLESHLSYRAGCGRSAPPSRAPCSASRTPTSCPPTRAWLPQAGPDDHAAGSRRAYVSGPPSGRVRVRRDEGARAGHLALHDLRGRQPTRSSPPSRSRTPSPSGRRPTTRSPLLDIAVGT